MYSNYFGFKERPFKLLPDPTYLFLSKSRRRRESLSSGTMITECATGAIGDSMGFWRSGVVGLLFFCPF